MATLRYEPEIAAPAPPKTPSAIRTKPPHNSVRPMLMINYHTNARNGALVRFNPALRPELPPPRIA